jgi:hypothetical protein
MADQADITKAPKPLTPDREGFRRIVEAKPDERLGLLRTLPTAKGMSDQDLSAIAKRFDNPKYKQIVDGFPKTAPSTTPKPASAGSGFMSALSGLASFVTTPILKTLTGSSAEERFAKTRQDYVSGQAGKTVEDAAKANREVRDKGYMTDPEASAALQWNATPEGRSLNHQIVKNVIGTTEGLYGTPLGLATMGGAGVISKGVSKVVPKATTWAAKAAPFLGKVERAAGVAFTADAAVNAGGKAIEFAKNPTPENAVDLLFSAGLAATFLKHQADRGLSEYQAGAEAQRAAKEAERLAKSQGGMELKDLPVEAQKQMLDLAMKNVVAGTPETQVKGITNLGKIKAGRDKAKREAADVAKKQTEQAGASEKAVSEVLFNAMNTAEHADNAKRQPLDELERMVKGFSEDSFQVQRLTKQNETASKSMEVRRKTAAKHQEEVDKAEAEGRSDDAQEAQKKLTKEQGIIKDQEALIEKNRKEIAERTQRTDPNVAKIYQAELEARKTEAQTGERPKEKSTAPPNAGTTPRPPLMGTELVPSQGVAVAEVPPAPGPYGGTLRTGGLKPKPAAPVTETALEKPAIIDATAGNFTHRPAGPSGAPIHQIPGRVEGQAYEQPQGSVPPPAQIAGPGNSPGVPAVVPKGQVPATIKSPITVSQPNSSVTPRPPAAVEKPQVIETGPNFTRPSSQQDPPQPQRKGTKQIEGEVATQHFTMPGRGTTPKPPTPPTPQKPEQIAAAPATPKPEEKPTATIEPPEKPVEQEKPKSRYWKEGDNVPPPGDVVKMETADLKVDPRRFQFKQDAFGVGGVTENLKAVSKFDPKKGGVLSVWRDPADGQVYVVNGHHRAELARRTNHPEMNVQFLDAPNAEQARAQGAMMNISEGRGTAIDAAKMFLGLNMTPEMLQEEGLSASEGLVDQGMALSKLADPIFQKVVNGDITPSRGVVIGKRIPNDPVAQADLVKYLETAEKRGKRYNNSEVDKIIGSVLRAKGAIPNTVTQMESLFGTDFIESGNFGERARIADRIEKRILSDKKLFTIVADAKKAASLEGAENRLNADENAARSSQAEQLLEMYRKFENSAGEVDDALNDAAREVVEGKPQRESEDRAYERIGAAFERLFGGKRAGGSGPAPSNKGDQGSGGKGAGSGVDGKLAEKPVRPEQPKEPKPAPEPEPPGTDSFQGRSVQV